MIPELGHFALILALVLAIVQATVPMIGANRNRLALMAVGRPAAQGQFLFLVFAFGCLTYSFVTSDFTLQLAATNSHTETPLIYKITGVWGNHEGSLLLWALSLSLWTVAVTVFSRNLPEAFMARVLGVLGWVSTGFLSFTLVTSNPFDRLLPAAAQGRDLNPLLQDPGMIIHPPLLYMGYVGFSVAFAFAIAALLTGRLDAAWARWSRPWTTIAWVFLTAGIAVGSGWAYYELGWGGWWFWDPVENASFMPWLVGTALIHSQAVTEKRGSFRAWTLLLSIFAFSLSLLGTFLVRSGVITSVHSFASDPDRGLFILAFLSIVVGGSLLIYALRAPRIAGGEPFAGASRETMLLINNLLFTCAAAMVFLGTLYPLFAEAFNLGRISVGPPYFGTLFVLLMTPVVVLIPFGPLLKWRAGNLRAAFKALRPALVLALVAAAIAWSLSEQASWKGMLGIAGAIWVGLGILSYALMRWRNAPAGRRYTAEMLGMIIAHFGVAVFVCGVLVTEGTSIEKDVRLDKGESVSLGAYTFRFDGVAHTQGPNYVADQGTITVTRGDKQVAIMHPQKRQYTRTAQAQTESDMDPGFTRDLYVALGEPLGDSGAWSVRVYVKPFIRWIWLGGLLMMLGGFVTATDRRFRVLASDPLQETAPGTSPAATLAAENAT